MASNAKCLFFFLLSLSFCLQTHARDSQFFSKVTKNTKESISISPAQAPTLVPSPSPEAEFVEHGYGLYGQEPYQNYQYPPTTTNPTKTARFGDEKFVPAEELSKNNFNEFEMAYSNNNFKGNGNGNGYGNGNAHTNGYVTEKQGLSDTRFLENGKYFYDINQDVKNEDRNEYVSERQGMSDTRFLENGKYFYDIKAEAAKEKNNGHFHTYNYGNGNGNLDAEKDTKFMENGKYLYGNNEEEAAKESNNGDFDVNNYENENENENENEKFEGGKQGLSDTRYLENGKYFYDVKNQNNYHFNNNHGVEDVGFHNSNNVEYAGSYYGNGNGNGNQEYEKGGREGYNYHRNEYPVTEGRGGYDHKNSKKVPNEYDTMEEYDREQGYIDAQDEYGP